MASLEALMKEARDLPPEQLELLLDFARFLRLRRVQQRIETAVLSEPVLSDDWLAPEEDAAWKDL